MQTKTDAQLLREYADTGAETAFGELVSRHADLVYSAALRQVIEPDLARDVAQSVFTDLARKAKSLSGDVLLAGWLYRSSRFAALTLLRNERRRQNRERQAMQLLDAPRESSPDWARIRPVLDEAMANLGDKDRDALVLRFFKNEDLRSVGIALGTSEDAAQKRISRALDKLRGFLTRHGVKTTATLLSTTLAANAVQAAPAGLAAALSAASVASASTTTTFTLLKLMTMTKLKAVAVSAAVITGVAVPVAVQRQSMSALRTENRELREESRLVAQLRDENRRLGKLRADADELERLRNEVAELHRLRGEVARLRWEREDAGRLAAENARLKERLANPATAGSEKPALTPEQERFQQQGFDRLNFTKQWMISFIIYADTHDGRLPHQFSDVDGFDVLAVSIEGLSPSDFEIAYSGKFSDLKEPNRIIVIKEKEPRANPDGKLTKAYGFADGHSELHSAPDGNFERWERERMVSSGVQ
jgi:RNA polymerase sigma factor (sigma-70 family)